MFEFKDKFNIYSPFPDPSPDHHHGHSDAQGEWVDRTESHTHYGYDYPEQVCSKAGIHFRTVLQNKLTKQNFKKIGGFYTHSEPSNIYNPLNAKDVDYKVFFKPDTEYKYIKLAQHLKVDDDPRGDKSRILKDNGFYFLLEGEAFDINWKSLGTRRLYIHEALVIRSEQMKFYYRLDRMMLEYHKTPEAGKMELEAHAGVIFNAIFEHKKMGLMFDFADTDSNKERIMIDNNNDLNKRPFRKRMGDIYIRNGAGFQRNLELPKEVYDGFIDKYEEENEIRLSPTYLFVEGETQINFPYYEAGHWGGFPGDNRGTLIPRNEKGDKYYDYPNFHYHNMIELMVVHEYIHALQHCLDPEFQGGRDIGDLRASVVDERSKAYGLNADGYIHYRRCIREIFAHHFCIFPNKHYDSHDDDPVFKYTQFRRGESATFGMVDEYLITFWILRTFHYYVFAERYLPKEKDAKLKADTEQAIREVKEIKACYEKKGYVFPPSTGSVEKDKAKFGALNSKFWADDYDESLFEENEEHPGSIED